MKQITIVTKKQLGLMTIVSEALANAGVNIETIQADSYGDSAVILLTVDRYDEALQVIHGQGMNAISEDAILLRLKDEPGALAKIARRFSDADIAIRSIRFIKRDHQFAFVAVSTERTDEALTLIQDVLVS